MAMLRIEIRHALREVDAEEWDALVDPNDPFVEHAFLHALEASGSVEPGTGWEPVHVLARNDGKLVGAVPLYLKTHSYGEYIFDWGWAEASEQAGLPYYPKLVSAVPFTPATGRRLLRHPDAPKEVADALLDGVGRVAEVTGARSIHLLFLTAQECALASQRGYLPRTTYQLHWTNPGYADFEDFLAGLRSRRRKELRRERRRASSHGLTVQTLTGPELDTRGWEALWGLYRDTTGRKHAIPYLTEDFFHRLRVHLAGRVVVPMAWQGERPVAAALCLEKGRHLYGRYWGAFGHWDALHFELCYHRPIQWCIERGHQRFEAGAQGRHKLERGLLPAPTYSVHHLAHPGLSDAVADFLVREKQAMKAQMAMLEARSPYLRG